MYQRPSAPQSTGGVLDDAIKLFRACLPRCWPLALLAQAAAALPGLMLRSQFRQWTFADPFAALAILKSGTFLLLAAFATVLFVIFNFSLIDGMNRVAIGTPASLGRSIGVGVRLLPRGFAAMVLVAMIIGLGFVLLVVPGIYWSGTLMLVFVVLVVEDTGVFQSLSVSSLLISGHWWRSVTIYTVGIIIGAVFYIVLGLIGAIIGAISSPLSWTAIDVQQLFSIAGSTLFTLVLTATLLAVYRDLQLRRAGAGLAPRAAGA